MYNHYSYHTNQENINNIIIVNRTNNNINNDNKSRPAGSRPARGAGLWHESIDSAA